MLVLYLNVLHRPFIFSVTIIELAKQNKKIKKLNTMVKIYRSQSEFGQN